MTLFLFDADERKNLFLKCANEYISAPVAAAAVATGAHGKPYFAEPPLKGNVHFSISHSGRYWAALFADCAVGLDIEDLSMRTRLSAERMQKIAKRFFAEDEIAYVVDSPAADMAMRFFRLWTAKESYIKYTGNGLSEGLSSFSALDPPNDIKITTFSHTEDIICSYCREGTPTAEIFFKGNKIEWT